MVHDVIIGLGVTNGMELKLQELLIPELLGGTEMDTLSLCTGMEPSAICPYVSSLYN
jgi:hypothetical protein